MVWHDALSTWIDRTQPDDMTDRTGRRQFRVMEVLAFAVEH